MNRSQPPGRLIELSHVIESGMITYPGLPAPVVDALLTHDESHANYAPGTEFHIGRIAMPANTGTYIDSPFHRFRAAPDIADLPLDRLANLPCVVVRANSDDFGRAVDAYAFADVDVAGCAVLVHTGWSERWGTAAYFDGNPFLTAAAAERLVQAGAALVGIDSLNIDDMDDLERPVHTALLAAGIPVVEHMRGLDQLPDTGARFFATPLRVRGLGSFPVRAFAVVDTLR